MTGNFGGWGLGLDLPFPLPFRALVSPLVAITSPPF